MDKVDFLSSSKSQKKDPRLTKIFAPQAIYSKKQDKKGVFMHFLENFDQKIAYFRRALPLKVSVYIEKF